MRQIEILEGDSAFAFGSDLSMGFEVVENYDHVFTSDLDATAIDRNTLFKTDVFDTSKEKQQFLAQYSNTLVKSFFLDAKSMTLGNMLLKANKLGCNMSKNELKLVGNILAEIPSDKAALNKWIANVNINSKFRDGWHGNHLSLSTLFKLNGLNWHWANGASSDWDKHPIAEVEAQFSAIHTLYGANDNVVGTILKNYAAIMIYGKVEGTDSLTVNGLAAAFNGETRNGDFSLFNSMTRQNLGFLNPNTTEYAYGLQQRLNSRILFLLFFTARRFAKLGIDVFEVPFVVCASPQIAAECEHEYMLQDAAADCLPLYLKYAKAGFPLKMTLPGWMHKSMGKTTWTFDSSTTAKQRATGAALVYVQGIKPNDPKNFGFIKKAKAWFNTK